MFVLGLTQLKEEKKYLTVFPALLWILRMRNYLFVGIRIRQTKISLSVSYLERKKKRNNNAGKYL
jgi:hypothetical protein